MEKEKKMDVKTLIEKLQDSEGFMISASLVNKNGRLDHYLILDSYNIEDVENSYSEVKKLVSKTVKFNKKNSKQK